MIPPYKSKVFTEKSPIYSTRLGDGFLRLPDHGQPQTSNLKLEYKREIRNFRTAKNQSWGTTLS